MDNVEGGEWEERINQYHYGVTWDSIEQEMEESFIDDTAKTSLTKLLPLVEGDSFFLTFVTTVLITETILNGLTAFITLVSGFMGILRYKKEKKKMLEELQRKELALANQKSHDESDEDEAVE